MEEFLVVDCHERQDKESLLIDQSNSRPVVILHPYQCFNRSTGTSSIYKYCIKIHKTSIVLV